MAKRKLSRNQKRKLKEQKRYKRGSWGKASDKMLNQLKQIGLSNFITRHCKSETRFFTDKGA